jgi:hypothetical protein
MFGILLALFLALTLALSSVEATQIQHAVIHLLLVWYPLITVIKILFIFGTALRVGAFHYGIVRMLQGQLVEDAPSQFEIKSLSEILRNVLYTLFLGALFLYGTARLGISLGVLPWETNYAFIDTEIFGVMVLLLGVLFQLREIIKSVRTAGQQ